MAKNNVGSLYYEILLSPNGYKKGAAAVRKEDTNLQSYLTKSAKEALSERDKIRAEAERASKHNWKKNANDPELRAKIQKAIVETAKSRLAEVAKREKAAAAESVALAKKEADKKAKIAQDLADKKREIALKEKAAQKKRHYNTIEGLKVLISKQKAIEDKAREKKRKADEQAARNAPRRGMMGAWDKFQGLAGKIGTVTMAVWPLVQVFKTLGRVVGSVVSAIGKMTELVDKFRMHSIKIATFMRGNISGAEKLTKQVEDYAMKTSLSVDAGLEMAASLLTLGVNASAVTVRLKQFNSVAMGNTDRFKRIAKAYTDVLGAGVLKATEMRQFTENEVKMRIALTEMLEEEGRLEGSIDDMISKRLITAKDVGNALERIGEEFKGLDVAVGDTLAGAWENLTEQVASYVRHSDSAKEATDLLVQMVKELEKLISGLAKDMEGLGVSINDLIPSLKGVLQVIKAINQARMFAQMSADFIRYGDPAATMNALNDLEKQNEKIAKLEHEKAVREEDARIKKAAEEKKAAEAKLSYEKALFDLQDKRNDAQKKYDEWRKSNNMDDMSALQQRNLNDLYYYKQKQEASEAAAKVREQSDLARADRVASQFEAALNTALPQDAFKQNSVEEFRYLQDQRKQAERDARDQDRFDKKLVADEANAKMIADSVDNISFSNTADTAI
ncbi:MAG: tape measure protein [Pirellulales bacterium]